MAQTFNMNDTDDIDHDRIIYNEAIYTQISGKTGSSFDGITYK